MTTTNKHIVQLFLTEEEYNGLNNRAIDANLSLKQYIKKRLFPEDKSTQNVQQLMKTILKKVELLENGKEFTIPSLFNLEKWSQYTLKDRAAVGRAFNNLVKKEKIDVVEGKKVHNVMTYEVKRKGG